MFARIFFVILSLFLVSGCSGSGGGDEDPRQPLIVSGKVEAPNGLIAANRSNNLLKRLSRMVLPFANASITGVLSVADGTKVDLVRINSSGATNSVLASTTTSGEKYSFDLTELGINFSSDLAVSTTGAGLQMRAFVTSNTVDINPVSEAAVRLVFEQIASTSSSLIQHFTIEELNDLTASIDILTDAHNIASGSGIEATVTSIRDLVIQNIDVSKFLGSAAKEGQTNEGPGDVANLFPAAPGDIWNFAVDSSDQNKKFFSSMNVTGTKLISGITATVVTESNVDNTGSSDEEYLVKNSRGITNLGNNDSEDFLTPQLVPYQQVNFPFTIGVRDEVVSVSGLDWKDDLDGDGQNETFSVTVAVTNLGKESIVLPLGSFPTTFRLEAKVDVSVTLSFDKEKVTTSNTITEWLAPGVGSVKITESIQTQGPGGTFSDTVAKELGGYRVNGTGRGVLPKFTVAGDLATANSNTETPGQPGIGSDGTKYLVVTCREPSGSAPSGVIGIFVSDTNISSAPFSIAQHSCSSFSASVAYDGVNYLIVFQGLSGGTFGSPEIFGVRVTPTGNVLDVAFSISPGSGSKSSPAVAFDGVNYLVVYGKFFSATRWDIYGVRVSPAGVILDEFPISSASGDQAFPSIAFDGTNYMAVWEDTRIGSGPSMETNVYGARISPAGVILDPIGIAIATAPAYQGDAQITFDGINYFVVWRNVESFFLDPPVSKIYGRRMKTDSALLDGLPETNGIAINTTALSKGDLAVAFNGENYFVVWRMGTFSNDPPSGVYAAKITPAGGLIDVPADSNGLKISGLPPAFSRYVHPTTLFNGTNLLLAWINNIELSGTQKSLEALYIYPY